MKSKLENLKNKNRETFIQVATEINELIYNSKPTNFDGDIFDKYSQNTTGYLWQLSVLNLLKEQFSRKYIRIMSIINSEKAKYHCKKCGKCCRFACSQYSPEKLSNLASNGDKTATDFLSVFKIYQNIDDAEKIYPEYVQYLNKNIEDGFYIYHCPKVTSENTCSDYENRPDICKNFPYDPVGFLPLGCAFEQWKNSCEKMFLEIKANFEIFEFYKEKIEGLL